MIRKLLTYSKLSLILVFLMLGQTQAYAKETTIYYYFPDSPISNLSQLKIQMEAMFDESQMKIVFQPFARLRDFESQQIKRPPDIIISSVWDNNTSELDGLLRAYRNGKSTYNKLLITSISNDLDQSQKEKRTIALTAMGKGFTSPSQLFDGVIKQTLENTTVIELVKDIDAVFAVALKQVDLALVSKTTLEKIKKINPRIVSSIKIIAESNPIPLPDLVRIVGSLSEKEIFLFVKFMKELKNQDFNVFKNTLSIDEWREIK